MRLGNQPRVLGSRPRSGVGGSGQGGRDVPSRSSALRRVPGREAAVVPRAAAGTAHVSQGRPRASPPLFRQIMNCLRWNFK